MAFGKEQLNHHFFFFPPLLHFRVKGTQSLKNISAPEIQYWISTAKCCLEFRENWQLKEPNRTSMHMLSTERVGFLINRILSC